MIPSDELERFTFCARDARDLAAQGRALEGYAVLELGLTWAETPALDPATGRQSAPEPWAAELIALYRNELRHYMTRNRRELGNVCATRQAQFTREYAGELRATARTLQQHSEKLRQRASGLTEQAEELVRQAERLQGAQERPDQQKLH